MNIKPITSLELYQQVIAQAKEDGHLLIAPTHCVYDKDGKVIGAITIMPTPMIWMDTRAVNVRDSVRMEEQLITSLAMSGAKVVCLPCTKDSPYHALLSKSGYFNAGSYDLFYKEI